MDRLCMLRDSYREVTGHAMPDDKDPNVAAEELRRRFAALVQAEDDDATDEQLDRLFTIIRSGAKIVKTLVRARHRARAKTEKSAVMEAQAAKHGWDEDRLRMLHDSYREITGHKMPSSMSPDEAIKELRRLIVPASSHGDLLDETLSLIAAAAKLKRGKRRRPGAEAGPGSDSILKMAFQAFDTDNSGKISLAELKRALCRSTPGGTQFTEEQATALLQQLDRDGDGEVDYAEWLRGQKLGVVPIPA